MLASLLASDGQQCQDTASIITSHVNSKGLSVLNYIDDFWGVAASKQMADEHLKWLQATLRTNLEKLL